MTFFKTKQIKSSSKTILIKDIKKEFSVSNITIMNTNSAQTQEEKIFLKISQILFEKKGLQTFIPQGSKGGFGLVLFVQDINTKLKYAVKAQSIIDEINGDIDQDKFEICKSESEILKSVKHKNIVEYHSDYVIGFYHFIQMNLCECSLDDWISKRGNQPLSYGMFLHFLNQILDGIEHLHSLNYVLRDLSVKNILISSDGTIKLCDFGLTKKIDNIIMTSKIQSNNVKGNQYRKQKVDLKYLVNQKVEIYVGICLSLLGGSKFLEVAHFNQFGSQIKSSPLLDSFCNEIIQLILKKNPKERPTISQIRKFLFDKLNQNKGEQQFDEFDNIQNNKLNLDIFYNQREIEVEFEFEKWKETEQECLKDIKNVESLIKLGQINFDYSYEIHKAYKNFIEALLINKNDPDIYLGLAQMNIEINSVERKDQEIDSYYIDKAFEISPNYWRVHFMKYFELFIQGKYSLGKIDLEKAMQIKKNCPLLIGHSYLLQFMQSKDMNEQKQILEKFENEFPVKYIHYYYHLGYFYCVLQNDDKGIESYLKQLKYTPNNPMLLYDIGAYYYNINKLDDAKQYIEKALEINPKYQVAQQDLQIVLKEINKNKNDS